MLAAGKLGRIPRHLGAPCDFLAEQSQCLVDLQVEARVVDEDKYLLARSGAPMKEY